MKRKILLLTLTLGFLGCISAQTPQALNCDNIQFLSSNSKLGYNHVEKVIKQNNMASTNQNTCLVDFVLDFDTVSQFASYILIYNQDGLTSIAGLQKGSNRLEVPTGTYDILANFIELDPMTNYNEALYSRRVIKEQVTINQNMTLNFATSEATNHIHFQPLTINGEVVNTGNFFLDDNWDPTIIEEANTGNVFYQSLLVHKDWGTLLGMSGFYSAGLEGSFYLKEVLYNK